MAGGYHKFIDSIQVGDTILAWNEDTKRVFPTPVLEALHHDETTQTLFDIELENRSKFTVNDNHPMYVVEDEGFVLSREFPDRFGKGKPITFLGDDNEPVKIVSLRMRRERCKVYNLHVEGQGEKGHTYFANGVVVHNKCFVAGTSVVMAGGYHKFIDSIQVGETVLAWNEETKRTFASPVVETLHYEQTMQTLFDIELEDRSTFTVNDNHPMYIVEDGRFVSSRELPARFGNGKPITFLGDNNQPVKLVSLRMRRERCKVYNLHVEGQGEKGHTYFANGIVVHNVKQGPSS
jgi:intein/homing endonuclease